MGHASSRLPLSLIIPLWLLTAHPGHAQADIKAARATLTNALDAHTRQGADFYLKTVNAWQQGNCKVAAKTVITGQVSGWKHRKDGSGGEELSLRFAPIACDGNETLRVVPVLAALRAPLPDNDDAGLGASEYRDGMMSQMASRGPMGAPSKSAEGVEAQKLGSFNEEKDVNLPGVKTGEVVDIRGVKMKLPSRGSDVTSLVSPHSITLDRGTLFSLAFFTIRPSR